MPASGDILAGCLLSAAFLAIVVVAEAWRRFGNPDPEWTRKLIHLSGGAIALCIPLVIRSSWVVLVMALAMSGFFALGKLGGRLRSLHGVSRKSRGTEYYPLVIYVLFCLTRGQPWKYVICVLVLAVADTLAALIGSRYGRIHYELDENRKSLEGSLVFFAAALLAVAIPLATWPDPSIPPLASCLPAALLVAVLATGFEAIAQDGRDNIWVPLGTFAVLTKILRQPLREIAIQNAKLAGLCLAVGLIVWWSGSMNVGGTLVFVLAAYGCWALTSFDWVLPVILAFALYLLVGVMCRHRPRFGSRTVVHWLLLPWLVVVAANFVWLRGDLAMYHFLYGPYLAACTAVTSQVIWYPISARGWLQTWKRIGGIAASILASWAVVTLVPWLAQTDVLPAALFWPLGATMVLVLPAALWEAGPGKAAPLSQQRLVEWAVIGGAASLVLAAQATGLSPAWHPNLGGGSDYSDPSGFVDLTRTVPAISPSLPERRSELWNAGYFHGAPSDEGGSQFITCKKRRTKQGIAGDTFCLDGSLLSVLYNHTLMEVESCLVSVAKNRSHDCDYRQSKSGNDLGWQCKRPVESGINDCIAIYDLSVRPLDGKRYDGFAARVDAARNHSESLFVHEPIR